MRKKVGTKERNIGAWGYKVYRGVMRGVLGMGTPNFITALVRQRAGYRFRL